MQNKSKFTNDDSKDQPTVQVASSSTSTSNAEVIYLLQGYRGSENCFTPVEIHFLRELKTATRKFRHDSLLRGPFDCVFKGWIEENGIAPVKPGTGLYYAAEKMSVVGCRH